MAIKSNIIIDRGSDYTVTVNKTTTGDTGNSVSGVSLSGSVSGSTLTLNLTVNHSPRGSEP